MGMDTKQDAFEKHRRVYVTCSNPNQAGSFRVTGPRSHVLKVLQPWISYSDFSKNCIVCIVPEKVYVTVQTNTAIQYRHAKATDLPTKWQFYSWSSFLTILEDITVKFTRKTVNTVPTVFLAYNSNLTVFLGLKTTSSIHPFFASKFKWPPPTHQLATLKESWWVGRHVAAKENQLTRLEL